MALHIHRAERTDLLADGLGALLSDPLSDPFAEDLVIVPAKGVERWLSQRLSHLLGAASGGDGVCAGVAFRNPRSLIADITGTDGSGRIVGTADSDPWSPDAMVWPLMEVIDATCSEDWCKPLAMHLGHFEAGDEKELRQGRRYAVARRLGGLFASYARQRPQLLVDWENGSAGDIASDLSWQPRSGGRSSSASTPTHRTSGTPKPLPGFRSRLPICRRGSRCSDTPGCRAPK